MNIGLITDCIDTEDVACSELEQAMDAASAAGVRLSFCLEGTLGTLQARADRFDLLFIDSRFVARWPGDWHRPFKEVAIVYSDKVELRMVENFSEVKYAIHSESMPASLGTEESVQRFFTLFFRQLAADVTDVRKALRMGIKA